VGGLNFVSCWPKSGSKDKLKGAQEVQGYLFLDFLVFHFKLSLLPFIYLKWQFILQQNRGTLECIYLPESSWPFQMSCWAAPSTRPRWTCGAWAASSWRWWPGCRRFRGYVIPTISWTRYSNCWARPPRTRGRGSPTFPATSRTSWVSNWPWWGFWK